LVGYLIIRSNLDSKGVCASMHLVDYRGLLNLRIDVCQQSLGKCFVTLMAIKQYLSFLVVMQLKCID
jgi:hypothetical protein